MPEYSKYDLNTYTLPLWEGDTVYNETLMFVDEKSAPLLYKPDRVISVRSRILFFGNEREFLPFPP